MKHSVELTLARLAFRQLTASRRSLWAVLLAALPVLIAFPMGTDASGASDAAGDFWGIYQALIVAVLLPIVALVVGTGVFGAEVEDGTLTYVLGKPVPRWRMVLTRIVVAGLRRRRWCWRRPPALRRGRDARGTIGPPGGRGVHGGGGGGRLPLLRALRGAEPEHAAGAGGGAGVRGGVGGGADQRLWRQPRAETSPVHPCVRGRDGASRT